jgi:hypothetical protein
MSEEISNKVALSSLLTIDLAEFYPSEAIEVFDMKSYLFMDLILKEKDFRTAMEQLDWTIYQDKIVAVTCTADAVIPVWAYMLLVSYLQPVASDIVMGDRQTAAQQVLLKRLNALDVHEYKDKRVVVKGCGDLPVGEFAYMEITRRLQPVVRSIMYGEPCSTVPVYKRK